MQLTINVSKVCKINSDEFGGLQPILSIYEGANVMLTRNIWVDQSLCRGGMSISKDNIYAEGKCPFALPLAVIIEFEDYSGPTFFKLHKKSVAIAPLISQAYVDSETWKAYNFLLNYVGKLQYTSQKVSFCQMHGPIWACRKNLRG